MFFNIIFVAFLLASVLSVLQFTISGYTFGIFKHVLRTVSNKPLYLRHGK